MPARSVYVVRGQSEVVTVSDLASMFLVAQRLSQDGPITIAEVFPDGSGRWIVAPQEAPEPEAAPTYESWYLERFERPDIEGYVARLWYWLVHEGLTERAAMKRINENALAIRQKFETRVPEWTLAKTLAKLEFGQRLRARRKR